MRYLSRLFLLAVVSLVVGFGYPASNAAIGTLTALAAKGFVVAKKATVQLTWTDTNTTVNRTIVQRRTTTDTVWKQVGYNFGKTTSFSDPNVSVGVKYIYRVRDSIPAAALGTWSDTAYTTIPQY